MIHSSNASKRDGATKTENMGDTVGPAADGEAQTEAEQRKHDALTVELAAGIRAAYEQSEADNPISLAHIRALSDEGVILGRIEENRLADFLAEARRQNAKGELTEEQVARLRALIESDGKDFDEWTEEARREAKAGDSTTAAPGVVTDASIRNTRL